MNRSGLLVALGVLLVASACGRGEQLGAEEAVEILVLDGLDRRRAECVVAELDGELDLEKMTGIDTELGDEELVRLSRVSAGCAAVLPDRGGVVEDAPPEDRLEPRPLLEPGEVVEALVRGGVAVSAATCVGEQIMAAPDPRTAAEDDEFLAQALLGCEAVSAPGR